MISYAKQRNYCFFLLRKTKKDYYEKFNEKDIADESSFGEHLNIYSLTKQVK